MYIMYYSLLLLQKPVPKSRGNSVQADSPAFDGTELVAGNVRVKAIHPWNAKKDAHLTFAKGDVILLRKQADNWYFGEKEAGGQSGWFPAQCVQVIADGAPAAGSVDQAEPVYVSVFDYSSDVEGDLAFRAGEIIRVTQKDGEWWDGRHRQ